MRIHKIAVTIFISSQFACNSYRDQLSERTELEITDTLEFLAIENLRSWEPPFHEEKFLNSFIQGKDFKFTVDGFHINDFEKWKSIVYESMDHERKNYKSYKHIISGELVNG